MSVYRNDDDTFFVSDNDVAWYHGHFATGNGDLNFYAQVD